MDPTAFHTIVQLVRNGTFDITDAEEIARRLDDEGEGDAAHAVRAAVVEAVGEQPAEERRRAMVLVPRVHLGPDGGNSA
jgi:hypothetical protein